MGDHSRKDGDPESIESESRGRHSKSGSESTTDSRRVRDVPPAKGHGQTPPRGTGIDRIAAQERKRTERELGPTTVERMEVRGGLDPDPSGFRAKARGLAERISRTDASGGESVHRSTDTGDVRGTTADYYAQRTASDENAIYRTPSDENTVYRTPDDESGDSGSSNVDPNTLHHIFDNPRHRLEGVVSEFGSQEAAFRELRRAIQSKVDSGDVSGVFEERVEVGSHTVTVRGKVIDGRARIGTAFKR